MRLAAGEALYGEASGEVNGMQARGGRKSRAWAFDGNGFRDASAARAAQPRPLGGAVLDPKAVMLAQRQTATANVMRDMRRLY
jgi:hypothetical protein